MVCDGSHCVCLGAGFACLDAINYAELERQYRCAQTILETQQLHVNNLKNRLIQVKTVHAVLLVENHCFSLLSLSLSLGSFPAAGFIIKFRSLSEMQ